MLILGLHFGHDASVSLIKDGKILVCLEKERHSRLKHAIGLDVNDIFKALKFTKHNLSDVDFCAVTSTQNIEYLFFDRKKLNFKIQLDAIKSDKNHWSYGKNLSMYKSPFKKNLLNLVYKKKEHPYVKRLEKNKVNFKTIDFVRLEFKFTSDGRTDEYLGNNKTSSKVSASFIRPIYTYIQF